MGGLRRGFLTFLLLAGCTGGTEGPTPDATKTRRLPPAIASLFASPAPDAPQPGSWFDAACSLPLDQLRLIERGYFPGRSHDLLFIPRAPNFIGRFDYTTHGGPWPYLQRVPLVFYGPGSIRARGRITPRAEVTLADVAPTLARLLRTPWPDGRAGTALQEVLRPGASVPRLVVVVVWDGAGTDVLRAKPGAWPHLRSLMRRGTYVPNAIVGSAPSVTPPVHATLGTGDFPDRHGIVDLTQRSNGAGVRDSFGSKEGPFTPRNLEVSTLADIHDRAVENKGIVGIVAYRGWHLGMMGSGNALAGGDRDLAAIFARDSAQIVDKSRAYSTPRDLEDPERLQHEIEMADESDGRVDGRWRDRISLEDPVTAQYTPAWTGYETDLVKRLIASRGFGDDPIADLLFVNYKQIDDVAHFYDMLGPEMTATVEATDDALQELTSFLDERVGRKRWALVVTADHGSTPFAPATGGWPINPDVLDQALAEHLGVEPPELFEGRRTMGYWFDRELLRSRGISMGEIADFLVAYTIEDATGSDDVPDSYAQRRDEPVFAAAFPSRRLPQILRCAQRRGPLVRNRT